MALTGSTGWCDSNVVLRAVDPWGEPLPYRVAQFVGSSGRNVAAHFCGLAAKGIPALAKASDKRIRMPSESVFRRIAETTFFEDVLLKDTFGDWGLVKEAGAAFPEINPDLLLGHVLLLRAYRHLGEYDEARTELEICRELLRKPDTSVIELVEFEKIVTHEETYLAT